MSKKVLLVIAVVLVAVLTIGVLVGCESYKNTKFKMDDATIATNNGGLVVNHGDYIYFVNGYSGFLDGFKENWFGNVLKGAILRIAKGETDMSKAEVIVPKSCISSASNAGFSIYGDYIYYTSSSTTETKSGTVDTSEIQFMRTRLDGQKTKVILKIENGMSTQYKYTPDGLVYLSDGTLYFKSTSGTINTKKKGTVLAEDVASVHFPVSETYDASVGYATADYFFYTKSNKESGNYTNELYVAKADGSVNKLLIDQYTYTSTPTTDSKHAYSISIVASKDEGDALCLLYTKSYYPTPSSTSTLEGTYMYEFKNSSFTFNKAEEIKLSSTEIKSATIIGYNSGVLSADGTMKLYTYDFDAKSANDPVVFADEAGSNKISDSKIIGVKGEFVYFYNSSDKLIYRYKLDKSGNVEYINKNKIHDSFIAPELVVDGLSAYIYYFNDDKGQYLYRVDLNSYDRKEKTVTDILFGQMTSEEASKYADAE